MFNAHGQPDQVVRYAILRRSSRGIEAWVIVAGWQTSDSTPPRLSASVISFSVRKKVRKLYCGRRVKEIIAPPFFAYRRLTSKPCAPGKPG